MKVLKQTYNIFFKRFLIESQDNERQILNLRNVAEGKGWHVRRTFQEKISGTSMAGTRLEFKTLVDYLERVPVDVVMVSEISRIGRKVVDVLNIVELLHEKGIALYIQLFNMVTMVDGQENPVAKMLLQMLSIGAEMENNQRRIRQKEGIKLAQMKGIYKGRKKGARAKLTALIHKYSDISDLGAKSELSTRRIACITGHSINTVRRIRQLKEM